MPNFCNRCLIVIRKKEQLRKNVYVKFVKLKFTASEWLNQPDVENVKMSNEEFVIYQQSKSKEVIEA